MPNQQNIDNLKLLNEKKNQAKSAIFVHYRGLSGNLDTQLRTQIKNVGGEMMVAKNTLLKLVFGSKELNTALSGPTAVIWAYQDEIAPLKTVSDFAKTNELPIVTAGFLDDKVLTQQEVDRLAKLPGKLELQAKVVGSLAAPLSGFVNVLQGNIRKFTYILKAIQETKH